MSAETCRDSCRRSACPRDGDRCVRVMASALRTGAATITAGLIALATGTGVGAGAALAPIVSPATCAKAPGQGLTLANIAADGSRLVAVGSNGLIATSSKPSAWTVRPTPVQHDLRGAVWTGSRWVVVGDLGTILSSPDGGMWQAANGIPPVGLRAVAARSGLVVAAGAAGALVSSPDGQNWTKQNSGTTEILWGGTALGSNVLVSGKDATVLASSDGSSWRAIPTHPFATGDPAAPRPFLWQLAADGSRLVTVGDFGAVLEGTLASLTAVHSPTDEILRGVTFGRGVGVAVGSSGTILRSVAAGRWSAVDSPTTVDLRGVAYTGSRFVAVGDERRSSPPRTDCTGTSTRPRCPAHCCRSRGARGATWPSAARGRCSHRLTAGGGRPRLVRLARTCTQWPTVRTGLSRRAPAGRFFSPQMAVAGALAAWLRASIFARSPGPGTITSLAAIAGCCSSRQTAAAGSACRSLRFTRSVISRRPEPRPSLSALGPLRAAQRGAVDARVDRLRPLSDLRRRRRRAVRRRRPQRRGARLHRRRPDLDPRHDRRGDQPRSGHLRRRALHRDRRGSRAGVG